jgi:hypothetical protein
MHLFFMAKYITTKTVLKVFSPSVLDKLSYDLPRVTSWAREKRLSY